MKSNDDKYCYFDLPQLLERARRKYDKELETLNDKEVKTKEDEERRKVLEAYKAELERFSDRIQIAHKQIGFESRLP